MRHLNHLFLKLVCQTLPIMVMAKGKNKSIDGFKKGVNLSTLNFRQMMAARAGRRALGPR